MKLDSPRAFVLLLFVTGAAIAAAQNGGTEHNAPQRPQGPCDIYAAAADPCAAAHSTTRALYASYNGPLYRVVRQSDAKALDIGVVPPSASDPGGYADAAAQDAFCANTYCWIAKIYDQSPKHNDLTQAPRGGFSGPAMGGQDNVPLADMAPVTVMGHKVYGVFIEPGMGLRDDDPKGTAVDDQAEGQYWVLNGLHYNSGCCFDYGNAETDSRDDDNGTMEATYFGDAEPWYHGSGHGPWIMTDQENNLVGCVTADPNKLCAHLPSITWRFVTGIAKGEPHHWTSMGGDAQQGPLSVMFDGGRVNATYDPMRKQGAILLGNGGDNSNGSQGTFYEGAMTAGGTFPSDDTDQKVQASIVAAHYAVLPLSIAPASAAANPPGLQTFTPGSSQQTTVTFTNSTDAPATGLRLSLTVPRGWKAVVADSNEASKTFADSVAPGASVSATFNVTSGSAAFNGDLVSEARWTNQGSGRSQTERVPEKVRNASPVKINEFRISSGPPTNATDSFIELYNAGASSVDLSNWTLTEHPTQQAIFSSVKIPAGTKLAAHGFYLLGLSNSGLAAAARPGDKAIYLRSVTGISAGDTVTLGAGANADTHKVASVGTAAHNNTTLWQPLPDGPMITIPAGATNVPVTSVAGFKVGEKVALGYGGANPTVPGKLEKYELATVTAIGKPGTQAYLEADAPAGSTNLQVSSVANISAGDKIRLDIDSKGHGIETVTVTHIGTQATHTNLAADASAAATSIKVRDGRGLTASKKITIGTPANRETVTINTIGAPSRDGISIDIAPALKAAHIADEGVVQAGTGLDLAAPLKFNHAANLPFSDRGTGITFTPATAFAHASDEPVQALGTGITLDSALTHEHAIDAAVRDAADTTAGYQGTPQPNQWFGGPELAARAPFFNFTITRREGSIVLRDAAGLVVDSLNYGGLVDPWAAEGYQAVSGQEHNGCYVTAPGWAGAVWPPVATGPAFDTSAGRFPDGADTGSNCTDFLTSPATMLGAASAVGATSIKVASVDDFAAGQTVVIDQGANRETAQIASVGTPGAATMSSAADAGATVLPVSGATGFTEGETISIGNGAETSVIASIRRFGAPAIVLSSPLTAAHAAGTEVSGTGITLTAPLTREHAAQAPVTGDVATPGAPNQYQRKAE
ncbi:MAG TPA: arabinofuranosidase catalytic domain-containing protein [Acidobacteriaceae bacterium]